MDVINHTTQGFLVTAIPATLITGEPTTGIILGSLYGVIAAMPDIIGEWYAHFKEKDGYKYFMYNRFHDLKLMNIGTRIILISWYLHILQDSFLHTNGKRWWILKERGWYEILTWIINIILIITFF